MMIAISNEKKWLIKSENKILGPYSFEQIEDLLLKKQISIIDEVRDTETRWLYLRENQQFKKIIEDVRAQIEMRGDSTKTIQNSVSQAGTKTMDEPVQQTRSVPQQYTDVSLQTLEASVVKETVDDVILRVQKEEAMTRSSSLGSKGGKFVYSHDPHAQKKAVVFSGQFRALIIGLSAVAVMTMAGFFYYHKYNQHRQETEILTEVKKLKFLGLGQQAVELYSRLPPSVQQKKLVVVLDLFPFLETLGFQMKNLDEVEAGGNLTLTDRVNIHLSRFWFYMQTHNLEMAQNQIVKAKTLQPADSLINENEAILNIRKGKYLAAHDAFLKLYQQENLGRYIFGAVQCLQGLSQTERAKFLPNIEKLVDRHIAIRFDYKKELLLAQMAFAKLKNNDVLFRLSWKQFLSTPTQLAMMFKKPTLLAPFAYQWKDLEQYKLLVRQGLNPQDDMLFQVHDYLESSQLSAASDFAEKSKNSIHDTASIQQISLLVNYALNRRSEIISLSRTGQLDPKSDLNHLLVGLTKVQVDPLADVKEHIDFLNQNHLKFYAQWIQLSALIRRNSKPEISHFLKENFLRDAEFILAQEARGMID
ncbi:MAG: hypothetical protein A2622_02630 [Bdellovibrionales bacterium RIFCSPHIGHO2_01_FULL_40_29]|nr:MAG: hypothetical protein A2622_02630 [Bdellovibrionales bacterium RIFCSPHIGHO2_01_FULL_40_29]OFZ33977.1 MAG: hypothetical protein A3D17_03050 [Bdellovibrionales bacterium RIFCSPHIGHO2_02_FULL_40_15]